ncbi:MAG: Na+ dependent nucleoside transporter [Bacteroidetes bacterium]|nr:Na+ dependent nucleoside transporter [Bacteroidota bacterium]
MTQIISRDEFLVFENDSSYFKYDLPEKKRSPEGFYTLSDSTLTFVHLTRYKETDIDSAVYKIINNNPVLYLYNDSAEVTRLAGGALQHEEYIRTFHIDKCTKDTLIFNDRGVSHLYVNVRPEEPLTTSLSPGFSFDITTILRGLLGMAVLIGIAFLFSTNRKSVSWRVVGIGVALQLILALGIIYVPPVQAFFEIIGSLFVKVLDFTKAGSRFLLGDLLNEKQYGFIFVFQILPTIVFFSALTSVLFYLGVIQVVVCGLAWVMTKLLKISGAESLSVAGNIFLGQTESPLMIKAYLEKMNKSEILLVMIGGMATVAGGVLAAYIEFLGGSDPLQRILFAKHLLAASIMAAPGAVVISKILLPQTEGIDKDVTVSKDKVGSNILDAMSIGTIEGLKLAANVGAMLLVFFAFIALANYVFFKIGDWTSLNAVISEATNGSYDSLSLQFILGYALSPLMWAIGVCKEDMTLVGQLLGEKLIASEFVGYTSLANLKDAGAFAQQKSIIISTYMLCGFANFASIGIQIGGIGSLAPNQRKLLSKFGMRALLGGSLASLLSATIIGMIMG